EIGKIHLQEITIVYMPQCVFPDAFPRLISGGTGMDRKLSAKKLNEFALQIFHFWGRLSDYSDSRVTLGYFIDFIL
ncbi:hypothetical protein NL485_28245, partial [Klebsiella pneumoniae]|nr:hypothetical protein [Klebsiella pneumoniae]